MAFDFMTDREYQEAKHQRIRAGVIKDLGQYLADQGMVSGPVLSYIREWAIARGIFPQEEATK